MIGYQKPTFHSLAAKPSFSDSCIIFFLEWEDNVYNCNSQHSSLNTQVYAHIPHKCLDTSGWVDTQMNLFVKVGSEKLKSITCGSALPTNSENPRGWTPKGLSGTVWSILSLDGQLVKKEGGVTAKRNRCSSKPALRPRVSQAVTDRRPHKQGLKRIESADSAQLGGLLFKCSSFKS